MSFLNTGKTTPAPPGWRPPIDQADPALLAAIASAATSTPPVGGPPDGASADDAGVI